MEILPKDENFTAEVSFRIRQDGNVVASDTVFFTGNGSTVTVYLSTSSHNEWAKAAVSVLEKAQINIQAEEEREWNEA
jgi:dihydrodipicolinate reductase